MVDGDAITLGTAGLSFLTLRAVAAARPGIRWRPGRGWAAAALGTVPLVLLLTGRLGSSSLWMLAVPPGMCVVAFPGLARARWVRVVLATYGGAVAVTGLVIVLLSLGMTAGGALGAAAAGVWLGGRGLARATRPPWVVSGGLVRLRLWIGSRVVEVHALVDSGTRVRDPATGRPLVVVAADALGLEFDGPPWSMERRRVAVTTAAGSTWLDVLSCPHAEMEVEGRWLTLPSIGVAVSARALAFDGSFQALLPAHLGPRTPGQQRGA
ncbi:MAG: sigma-E processing peptidase SpoIIGA [Thermaerobacter sp.]|nr:sigma-E processing peptidase SpoIIGA [Thermaerobacter sp.]